MDINTLNVDNRKVEKNLYNYRVIKYICEFITSGYLNRALLFDKREFEIDINDDDIFLKITFSVLEDNGNNRYDLLHSIKILDYYINSVHVYVTNLIFAIDDLELLSKFSCIFFDIDYSPLDCDVVKERLNGKKVNLDLLYQNGFDISTSGLTQLSYVDLLEDSVVLSNFDDFYNLVLCRFSDDIVFDTFHLKLNSIFSLFELILNDFSKFEQYYSKISKSVHYLNISFNYNSLVYLSRLNSEQIEKIVKLIKDFNIIFITRIKTSKLNLHIDSIKKLIDEFNTMFLIYICDLDRVNLEFLSLDSFYKMNSSRTYLLNQINDVEVLKFLIKSDDVY